jgi:hypothetical protein
MRCIRLLIIPVVHESHAKAQRRQEQAEIYAFFAALREIRELLNFISAQLKLGILQGRRHHE